MNVHPQLRAAWLLLPCVNVTVTESSTKGLFRLDYFYVESCSNVIMNSETLVPPECHVSHFYSQSILRPLSKPK